MHRHLPLVLLVLTGCPAPEGESEADTDAASGDAVDGELDGRAFPSSLSAFWYELPPPTAYAVGPAMEVSTRFLDTEDFADNALSIGLVVTDHPDACASLAGWWAETAALRDGVAMRDADAIAALDEAEGQWLAQEFTLLSVGVSADAFAGAYDLATVGLADAYHHRDHTDWPAALDGAASTQVDWYLGEAGTLTIASGGPGETLRASGTASFGSDGNLAFTTEATPCPAAGEALGALLE